MTPFKNLHTYYRFNATDHRKQNMLFCYLVIALLSSFVVVVVVVVVLFVYLFFHFDCPDCKLFQPSNERAHTLNGGKSQ